MKFNIKSLLPLLAAASAAVIEATDDNLNGLLKAGVPTILDIYAPWCGHCRTFAPIFDELASKYEHAADKIQFIKIDGDTHRDTSSKYEIQYFPTIKWVVGESHEPIETRDINQLIELIESKTGVKPKAAAAKVEELPKAEPIALDDANFAEITKGKNALVAFTATWCGHCKRLKPIWEELAQIYADDELLVANIDCTEDAAQQLTKDFEIRGFPTVFLITKSGERIPYQGERSAQAFVAYVQENDISHRDVNGQLGEKAGIIAELAEDALKFAADAESEIDNFIAKLLEYDTDKSVNYGHYALRIRDEGIEWAQKEYERIGKLLTSGSKVAKAKIDDLRVRSNVLRAFLPREAADKVEEKADL